jgi:hypothetical protein
MNFQYFFYNLLFVPQIQKFRFNKRKFRSFFVFLLDLRLTGTHRQKSGFMRRRRSSRAALCADAHFRFGRKRLRQKHVGNDADIRAYADKFHSFKVLAADILRKFHACEQRFIEYLVPRFLQSPDDLPPFAVL